MSKQPQFELLTGPSGDYYYFQEEITERIGKQAPFQYDFICFLPVKRAVRYFKEKLVDTARGQVLAHPPIFTFYEFMIDCYRKIPGAKKIISPAMRLFLVEAALKENIGQFRFFSDSSARRRGLVRKVDTLLTELREYGYSPELLQQQMEAEDDRIHDFALCIDAFETLLGDRLIDEAGAIQAVIDYLDTDSSFWQTHFPTVNTIYMGGYGLFSRPMIRFFEVMRHRCNIKIKLDYIPEYPQLFSHVDPAFEALCELSPTVIQDTSPAAWETQLFRRHNTSGTSLPLGKKVLVQPANSRSEEIAFIANYVKRLHYHQKIPLHRIGLTFPSLEEYAPLIHDLFPRYGVPYNLSTGYQLSQSPLIRSFLLVLEVPMLRYDIKKLVQLLSSPFFLRNNENHPNISAIKNIARELRLTHFSGNWQQSLNKHIAHLQGQVDEHLFEDEYEMGQLQKTIGQFEETLSRLDAILPNFQALEARQPVQQFREKFLQALEAFGFLDWYKEGNPELSPPEQEREFRAFNRFSKLLDQFSWIVTNLHGEQKLTLKEYHQYLSLLVSQATYNLREWADYGVQIMPRLEVLSAEPEILIFGGMVEGEFPRPYTQDVFFHDDEREVLGLSATEDLLAQDRYLFYQLLSAPADKLVFTYPRFKKEAARVPSNFLNVLADQIEINWRKQSLSPRFLQNTQSLLTRVALQIPAGISPAETQQLQKWLRLRESDNRRFQMTDFWLRRIANIYSTRKTGQFGEYEGVLENHPDIIDSLQQRFGNSAFSITRLETFAFCPIQFYFRYLAGLSEEEEVEQGLTALERGQMVHQTLFRFYQALKKENRQEKPWLAADLLKEIAREEFDNLPFSGMLFELERERYFGNEVIPGLWDIFLQQEEQQIGALQFFPAFFEIAFGRAGRKSDQDAISSPQPIELTRGDELVKLIGKVDRIDLDKNGNAILLDYKTGSSASHSRDVLNGISLQMPVYAAILSQLLERSGQTATPVMTATYQVKDAENCSRIPEIFDKNAGVNISARNSPAALPGKLKDGDGHALTFLEVLDIVEGYIFKYVNNIRNGAFRHTRYPDSPGCENYCEFRRICRKDVRKLLEERAG